jgi:transcription-repair coupling factor (superfamily II helicase)
LSLEAKENHDNPECGEQSFSENRESFLDYISEKTVLFIQNSEDLFSQLDKQFDRAEEAEKLSKDIKHACQINYF